MKIITTFLITLFSLVSFGQFLTNYTNLSSYTQTSINNALHSKGIDTTSVDTNPVISFSIEYKTVKPNGDTTIASGAVYLPILPNCYNAPVLIYEHGTQFTKTSVPSMGSYFSKGKHFAGLGYITIMPDYIGLGVSTEIQTYHHSETEASASLDLVRACREFLLIYGAIQDNKKIFITGYSQGGHVAMATNKYVKDNNLQGEFNIIANAPLSGAYFLSGSQRDLVFDDSTYSIPLFLPNIIISYQSVYGNLFNSYNETFDSPYDSIYEVNVTAGTTSGYFWFVNTPANHYQFLQDTFVNNMINDVNRNYHPMNLALKDNDLHNWTPQNPVRMIYCNNDDVVSPENSRVALDTMLALGATDVQAIDIYPSGGHNSCATPAIRYATLWFDSLRNSTCVKGSFSKLNLCRGDSVLFNGIAYYNDTLITDTLQTNLMEDSIVTIAINVIELPIVKIVTTSNDSICENQSVILNAQGAVNYTWSHNIVEGTGFYPQEDSNYVLTGINQSGCESFDTISFIIIDLPVVSTSISESVICSADSITLNQNSNGLYGSWNAQLEEGVNYSITQNTTFTYTSYSLPNCSTVSSVSVVVNAKPDLQLLVLDSNICLGDSIQLVASGASTLLWNNGLVNNTYISPVSTNYYQVVGSMANGCTDSLGFNLVVNDLPNVVAHASVTDVCVDGYSFLSGSGAQTYIWNNNVVDNAYTTVAITSMYIVEGVDANSCKAIDSILITVNSIPSVISVTRDTAICEGDSIYCNGLYNDLQYEWSNNIVNNSFVQLSGSQYLYVTATNTFNCTQEDSILITVNTLPNNIANVSSDEICKGDSILIWSSGNATNFYWSNGLNDNAYHTPELSGYVTLNATSIQNCIISDSLYIEVSPLPMPVISESNGVLSTLNYNSYQWYKDGVVIQNATAQNFTPISNGNYRVEVDSNSCLNSSETFSYLTAQINSSGFDFNIAIYPNPSLNYIYIKSEKVIEKVMLINSLGEYLDLEINNLIIDISNLAQGQYTLILTSEGIKSYRKFVKI